MTAVAVAAAAAVTIALSFCICIGMVAGFGDVEAIAVTEPVVIDVVCTLDAASTANTGDGSGLLTSVLVCGIVGVFGDAVASDFMATAGF